MNRPHFEIDFNKVYPTNIPPGHDLIHLSYVEKPRDRAGNEVELFDGMEIYVYTEDVDNLGRPCIMIALATAISNPNEFDLTSGRSISVKWMCQLASSVKFIPFEEQDKLT
jgi:hypothetical protein